MSLIERMFPLQHEWFKVICIIALAYYNHLMMGSSIVKWPSSITGI